MFRPSRLTVVSSDRIQIIGIVIAALILGAVLRPVEQSAQAEFGQGQEASELRSLSTARMGQGMSLALLGGYRPIVANMVWMAMDGAWYRRDFDTTLAHIKLATSIDPRHELFWLNGSRIIANDMPAWRIGRDQLEHLNTTIEGRMIREEFAEEALALLADGVERLPENPLLLIEMAVIEWRKNDDLERAAELFLEASQMPEAPFFAGRIYAELLEKLGRERESLAYLKDMLKDLPAENPMAMVPVVKDRIRKLELKLKEEG